MGIASADVRGRRRHDPPAAGGCGARGGACGGGRGRGRAGATWDVYPGAGTPIQDAVDGAGEGGTIYVHAGGRMLWNVDVDKRVTLVGVGVGVRTVDTKMFM